MADLPNLNLVSTNPISYTSGLRATATINDPRIEGTFRFDQVQVGKSFQAEIMAILRDGNSLVKFPPEIPGEPATEMQLALPPGFNVGDKIQLKLLSPPPNLSFGVLNTLAQNPPSDSVLLSPQAKLLGQLLQTFDSSDPKSTQLTGSSPLLSSLVDSSDQMATQLPTQLHQAVQMSGAFYESHLKEWVNGQRTLEQIQQEPQNQKNLADAMKDTPLNTNPLVQQQLHILENRQILWHGQLLPNQPFEWEIHEEPNKQSSSESEPSEKIWNTSVKFQLPNLGDVNAHIQLIGDQVHLRLRVSQTDTSEFLTAGQAQLSESLAASGNQLIGFSLENDGSIS